MGAAASEGEVEMPNNSNATVGNGDGAEHGDRTRFRVYWIAAVCSILVFVVCEYFAIMMQYPPGQFPPTPGLWMCVIPAVTSGFALVVGFWKYRSAHAPMMKRPLGLLLALPVALVFMLSIIGAVQMASQLLR